MLYQDGDYWKFICCIEAGQGQKAVMMLQERGKYFFVLRVDLFIFAF